MDIMTTQLWDYRVRSAAMQPARSRLIADIRVTGKGTGLPLSSGLRTRNGLARNGFRGNGFGLATMPLTGLVASTRTVLSGRTATKHDPKFIVPTADVDPFRTRRALSST